MRAWKPDAFEPGEKKGISRRDLLRGAMAAGALWAVGSTFHHLTCGHDLEIRNYEIQVAKEKFSQAIKMVFLADLHLSPYNFDFVAQTLKKVRDLDPDLILIGGDICDEEHQEEFSDYAGVLDVLSGLNIVSDPGNHDFVRYKDIVVPILRKKMERIGVFLPNKVGSVDIHGEKIYLIGVGSHIFHQQMNPAQVIAESHTQLKDHLALYFPHEPHGFKFVPELNKKFHQVDIVMGGHTHGASAAILAAINLGIEGAWTSSSFTAEDMEFNSGLAYIPTANGEVPALTTSGVGTSSLERRIHRYLPNSHPRSSTPTIEAMHFIPVEYRKT